MTTMDEPVLPYADAVTGRSSGWSGSVTSQDRAHREDADGTTSQRQRAVLGVLAARGERGATWREVGEALGTHHGQASGALSALHKGGRVARLTLTRDRCAVYVLPEHVEGRATAEQGRHRTCPHCGGVL